MTSYLRNSISKKILDTLERYETITLFHHVSADGDAYGSCFGLKYYLQQLFSNKHIYVCGESNEHLEQFFGEIDYVDDLTIENSLAVVLDTANSTRVSDQRYINAQYIVRIDHHPHVENFGHLEYIDSQASSCCEMIAKWINDLTIMPIEKKCAQSLLAGMITDTNTFTTPNVTPKTLEIASYLLKNKANIAEIVNTLFKQSLSQFDFNTVLRSLKKMDGSLLYAYVSQDDYKPFNLSSNEVKQQINMFKSIENVEIYVILVENDDLLYDVSIRSKSIIVNDIAQLFGGGGHTLACATKNLSFDKTQYLLHELRKKL